MTLDPETQQTLVTGLQAGRAESFGQLYDALHAKVFNFVARTVGDREEAADITQEVFLEAYRRIPSAPADMRLEPWIYRVASNTAIDHLRRRRVRRGEPLPDGDQLPAPHDAYDAYQQSETAALVGTALMGMNDRYRVALVLKDLHGLDNREVASVLGVSRGAADVILFRARHAFKKTYSRLSGEPLSTVGKVAGLAPLLPALAVPAALHGAPALPAAGGVISAVSAATAATVAVDVSAPVAAGLFGKLTTGFVAKAAAVAAAAALVGGGTIVAVEGLSPSSPTAGARAETSGSAPAALAAGGTSVTADDHADWEGYDNSSRRRPHGECAGADHSDAGSGCDHGTGSGGTGAGTVDATGATGDGVASGSGHGDGDSGAGASTGSGTGSGSGETGTHTADGSGTGGGDHSAEGWSSGTGGHLGE